MSLPPPTPAPPPGGWGPARPQKRRGWPTWLTVVLIVGGVLGVAAFVDLGGDDARKGMRR